MGLGNRLPTSGGASLPSPSGRRAWLLGRPHLQGVQRVQGLEEEKGKPRPQAGSRE